MLPCPAENEPDSMTKNVTVKLHSELQSCPGGMACNAQMQSWCRNLWKMQKSPCPAFVIATGPWVAQGHATMDGSAPKREEMALLAGITALGHV